MLKLMQLLSATPAAAVGSGARNVLVVLVRAAGPQAGVAAALGRRRRRRRRRRQSPLPSPGSSTSSCSPSLLLPSSRGRSSHLGCASARFPSMFPVPAPPGGCYAAMPGCCACAGAQSRGRGPGRRTGVRWGERRRPGPIANELRRRDDSAGFGDGPGSSLQRPHGNPISAMSPARASRLANERPHSDLAAYHSRAVPGAAGRARAVWRTWRQPAPGWRSCR